jgi:putative toxin-antitoxin system antitoxin component (TIGR02293 family)
MTIADVLGSGGALRAKPRTAAEWSAAVSKGFSIGAAEAVKRWLAVGDDVLAAILGVSQRTLSRARASKARLNPVMSDRLYRVARVGALATEVMEDEGRALGWLKRPQSGRGGRTPLALLTTDAGCIGVGQLLTRIEHGVYA